MSEIFFGIATYALPELRRSGFSSPQRAARKNFDKLCIVDATLSGPERILDRAISAERYRVSLLSRERESISKICLFRRYADWDAFARIVRRNKFDTTLIFGKRLLHLNRSVLSTSYAAGKYPRLFTAHYCPIRVVCRQKKRGATTPHRILYPRSFL